jgi:nucleoside-diphosphate-sugar epimerase
MPLDAPTTSGPPAAYFPEEGDSIDVGIIDIGSYHANDTAFRTATGWAPATSLNEGLRLSLAWYRERLTDYL